MNFEAGMTVVIMTACRLVDQARDLYFPSGQTGSGSPVYPIPSLVVTRVTFLRDEVTGA
jgi:hypothetical protein